MWALAAQCPGIPLVVLGALESWENIQFIREHKGGGDNLFYDLLLLSESWDLDALAGSIGAGRLLLGSGGRMTTPQDDCAHRLAFMDSFGIGQAALMPGHSYRAPNGLADVRAINDALHTYARLAPERSPAVFGTLDPRHGDVNVAEVERLAAMGFRGLSWHHRMQGLTMDHPVMFAIAEPMAAHGMVFMAHCYGTLIGVLLWVGMRVVMALIACTSSLGSVTSIAPRLPAS